MKNKKEIKLYGKLDENRGLFDLSQKYGSRIYLKSIKTYGYAMVLSITMNDLIPVLKDNSDNCGIFMSLH